MYCPKCGNEIREDNTFCSNCGLKLENSKEDNSRQVPPEIPKGVEPKKKSNGAKVGILIAVVAIVIIFAVLFFPKNGSNNQYVQMVKGGHPYDYPNVTYEEAFESFFSKPKWMYFEADTGQDIVQFEGGCLYYDKEVDVVVQFELDVKESTIEIYAVEMNGIPQNKLFIAGLIATIFEDY